MNLIGEILIKICLFFVCAAKLVFGISVEFLKRNIGTLEFDI